MKNIISASFILIFNIASAQNTKLSFLTTDNFNSSDNELFLKIRKEIIGKNEKKANEYQFSIQSALNEEIITIDKASDLNLIDNNSFNSIHSDKNEEIEFIKSKVSNLKYFEFKINSTLNLNFENSTNDYQSLLKWIKKNSGDELLIIWNNGYRPFKFSSENIIREISNKTKEGSLEQITPKITKPKYNEVLRPDNTSIYYFEFDSVGIFPSYNIQVYWKKPIGKDYYNNTIYDSILFLDECLQFTSRQDYRNLPYALFATDDSKCKVAVKVEYLANICYKLEQKIINTDEVPDHDDTCTPCKYECLYQKKFSLIVKGCSPGIKQELIPEAITNLFLFQCNSTQN
jgi:hypothetical protein